MIPAVVERDVLSIFRDAKPGARGLTLMELMEFAAHSFCRITAILAQIRVVTQRLGHLDGESFGLLGGNVRELRAEADRLGLLATRAQADRIEMYVTSCFETRHTSTPLSFDLQTLGQMASDLHVRVLDELEGRLCFIVQPERREYVVSGVSVDQAITDAFPSTVDEFREAGKCFGFGRSTAAVFHLMRVLEAPLAAISSALGIVKHSPTWNAYLSAMTEAIKVVFPDKTKAHADKREYFAGLEGQLRAIKDAWRNPTMHQIAKVYTDEMAYELIVLVRGFMREVATELHE